MLISKKKIDYLYSEATARKDEIKSIYNTVLEYVDPFATIEDSGKQKIGTQRKVDSVAVDAIDALTSFVMSSILTRTGKWASIEIDKERLIEENGEGVKTEIEELEKVIDEDMDKVFKFIQSSNYYNEIAKAVQSFIKVGTGAYAIRETGSTSMPFSFSYIGLDNLFVLEDSMSNPAIIFKKHPEVNADYIMDNFGRECKLPKEVDLEDPSATMDVIECIIPEYDEVTTVTKYNYMVMDSGLSNVIFERVMDYSVINVFR